MLLGGADDVSADQGCDRDDGGLLGWLGSRRRLTIRFRSETTGHAESVKIVFDPSRISYGTLLRVFFSVVHDPTQLNRQGPDVGTSYRSVIFYTTPEQEKIAKAYIAQLDAAHVFPKKIVTEVVPLKAFYDGEEYHQDYAEKNPNNPYIQVCDVPKVAALQAAVSGVVSGLQAQVRRRLRCLLLGDFALGFVGGVVDFGLEAFEQTLQEGVGVGAFILDLVSVSDVTGEVGEDDAPGEGVFPGATSNADVLALLGDPDAHDLEGCLVALCCRWNGQIFLDTHFHLPQLELR